MVGRICGLICIVSFFFGIVSGNVYEMGSEIINGAGNAVTLTLSLVGTMCLWSGIMEVADRAGVTKKLAKIMSPLFRLLFPDAHKKQNGIAEISASITANVFGIGNAATPLAINAMKKLQENNYKKDKVTNDMVMFAVLGCASLDIFPTTLIALRQAAGSADPFEVIIPIWICSSLCALLGVLLVKLLSSSG